MKSFLNLLNEERSSNTETIKMLVRNVVRNMDFKLLNALNTLNRPYMFNKKNMHNVFNDIPSNLEDTDDKFEELNDMYVDMFTNNPRDKISVLPDNKKIYKSEIDELNEEFDNLTTFSVLDNDSLELMVSKPGRFIIQSLSNDPYYNLALEDYIFKHTPLDATNSFHSERLFFYINNKCAVIGKNQIIWQELYVKELQRRGYEILRRFSGGGAVIHDLGNVNFSFFTSRSNFDTSFFTNLIIKWLNLNDRNNSNNYMLSKRGDIWYKGKKCSGSAFKIARGKAYHHGTMLVDSQIENFSGLLKPKEQPGVKWDSPSVESVRSSVSNISIKDVNEFIRICKEGFSSCFGIQGENSIPMYYCNRFETINQEIKETMNKLKSHKWKYDTGPKFKVHLSGLSKDKFIEVEHGHIIRSTDKNIIGMRFEQYAKDFLE